MVGRDHHLRGIRDGRACLLSRGFHGYQRRRPSAVLAKPACRRCSARLPARMIHRMTVMSEPSSAGFPVTTALELRGMTVERDLGVAFGLVVRSMGFAKGVAAGFKALRQGEVSQYTELLEDSRRHAIDRMIDNARLLG